MKGSQDETLSVLLVEDNEIDVEITRRALARSRASVDLRVARDGLEALELLYPGRDDRAKGHLPQLLLLDLRLPGIDGWRILRRIKNDPDLCAIPVAVLTGVAEERQMLECMALGSNMYFVKPMQVSEIAALVPAIRNYWKIMELIGRDQQTRAA